MESFQKALMLDQNHIQSLQLRGMMLYHHGSLQEAIGNFKVPRVELAPIMSRASGSASQLQPRRRTRFKCPSPYPAVSLFKQRCLQLEPYNEVCQYMKGLSHVAMGQFYEGIKAQTKVMLNDPLLGQKASSEYLKVKYLRGARTHSKQTLPHISFHSFIYSNRFEEKHKIQFRAVSFNRNYLSAIHKGSHSK